MSNAVPQKKTFFQIANKNFIMLFVAYTVICITHSMTNSVTSAGWRLAGMDLTTCTLDRIVLSETCRELKGAVINAAQAAVVARILGIRVEM